MDTKKIKKLFFDNIPRFASHFTESKLFDKIKTLASRAAGEVLLPVLRLYYVMQAPTTPTYRKLHIAAALGYFIFPFDFIPDFLAPILGFADDLVVLSTILKTVSNYCTPEIEEQVFEAYTRIMKSKK